MLKMQSEILRDIVPVMTYKKVFFFVYIYRGLFLSSRVLKTLFIYFIFFTILFTKK